MWFGSTELVNAEQEPLHFALPGPGDWEALVAREAAVRDFALGHSVIDIHTHSNPTAHFVDVHNTVHSSAELLTARDILGVDAREFTVDDVEFSSSGPVAISITRLERSPASGGGVTERIIWTKTWQLDSDGWRILGSHASRSALAAS